MEDVPQGNGLREIDVRSVLTAKNPSLGKIIPGFLISYLKRIVHQDEMNIILKQTEHLRDSEFIEELLRLLEIKYKVYGRENIPADGRYIFASNHPLGGLDGLVFMNELSKYYKAIKFPVNDILMNIRNLSGIFLPVNKHGSQGKDAVRQLDEAYSSDCQILYFPAGLCSRKRHGVISDLTWHKSFITKAVQYKRDIVPVFFSGRNSNFFYNLANIRTLLKIRSNFEMLYLPDEMFRQKGQNISIVFGEQISWQTFSKEKSPAEWAALVRSKSYELVSRIP